MKATILKEKLIETLLSVTKVVQNKPINSLLETVVLAFGKDTLTMTAGNGETMVTMQLKEGVTVAAEPGIEFLAMAKPLTDSIREMPEGEIEISYNPGEPTMTISWATGSCKAPAYENDFPYEKQPDPEAAQSLDIPAAMLLEGLEATFFAAADDMLRPNISAILIETGTVLGFTATNLMILTHRESPSPCEASEAQILLPRSAADIVRRLIPDDDEPVHIVHDGHRITFTHRDTVINTRLEQARFPAYRTIIPKNSDTAIILDRKTLSGTVSRSSIYSDDDTICLAAGPDGLTVKARSLTTKADTTEKIEATVTGESTECWFPGKHMKEILRNINGDNVTLRLSGPSKPILIEGQENEGYDAFSMLLTRQAPPELPNKKSKK